MEVANFARVTFIVFVFIGYSYCENTIDAKLRNLENADQLISADIIMIKQKVWIELTSQIQTLNERIEIQEQKLQSCPCIATSNTGSRTAMETHNDVPKDPVGDARYTTLIEAFKSEKARSKLNELDIATLNTKFDYFEHIQNNTKHFVKETTHLLNSVNSRTDENKHDIEKLNMSLLNKTHDIVKTDWRQRNFRKPSFISEWTLMKSQDLQLCELSIPHDLGTIPYKVLVQMKPSSGPNGGWIFHGDSAFQSDDDTNGTYGGIVYLYNETHIKLFAPKKNNNGNAGAIINTGKEHSRRIGENHQTTGEAFVRVKVWGPNDIISPDFKSEWINLDVEDSTLSFHEIQHGLNGYPALVNVQIRGMKSNYNLISEGVGATTIPRVWLNGGGVAWGYNANSVRMWTYFLNTTKDYKTYGRLFGSNDGWGETFYNYFDTKKGNVRILAWSRESLLSNTNLFKGTESTVIFTEANKPVPNENDLLQLYVQADEGPNKGYRFPGYGNSQNIKEPFGGVVYAYSTTGDIRLWRPNPEKSGYLVHINAPYGNGVNVQASNNASLVVTLVQSTP